MNIYVSHLSWGTSSEGLGNLFMQFGEVASANVITDRETGRSRGFGFVEMPNDPLISLVFISLYSFSVT